MFYGNFYSKLFLIVNISPLLITIRNKLVYKYLINKLFIFPLDGLEYFLHILVFNNIKKLFYQIIYLKKRQFINSVDNEMI